MKSEIGSIGRLHVNTRVSVIIPCYNHGEFLKEAIQSVYSSDFEDYEVIVVNDGSTEALTLDVFNGLQQDSLNYPQLKIIHQENLGLSSARNAGIQAAKSEYILPLDADNRIRPHYLKKALEVIDSKPEIGIIYGHIGLFGDEDGIRQSPPFDPKKLLLGNFVEACSLFRKRVWEECGGYDAQMRHGYEDWDFWISAMEKGWKFYLIREVLFEYRVRKGSMLSSCNLPENRYRLITYICNKHKHAYIENLCYVISEKDVECLAAYLKINRLNEALREKEWNYQHILSGRGWRLLIKYYKTRDRLLPMGTRRRAFAKAIFRHLFH